MRIPWLDRQVRLGSACRRSSKGGFVSLPVQAKEPRLDYVKFWRQIPEPGRAEEEERGSLWKRASLDGDSRANRVRGPSGLGRGGCEQRRLCKCATVS